MSNNRGFEKSCKGCECCEECRSFSKVRVSSCPQEPIVPQDGPEPPPVVIPVYGSLYGTGGAAVSGTNVDFDAVGPSSGVTLNIVDDSITVNSSGVYTITFSTEVNTGTEGSFSNVTFRFTINGTPIIPSQISFQTAISPINVVDTLSRTIQLMLNQGDVIRVFIFSATSDLSYAKPALVVTKVA